MVTAKGGKRSLSLVAIATVMLLHGVAEADNPCYGECWRECVAQGLCSINPVCIGLCSISCATGDTCRHHRSFSPDVREQTNADANHYCKMGCASSVCAAISTILPADHVSESATKGSADFCNKACSGVCAKRFGAAVGTA